MAAATSYRLNTTYHRIHRMWETTVEAMPGGRLAIIGASTNANRSNAEAWLWVRDHAKRNGQTGYSVYTQDGRITRVDARRPA